MSLKAMVTPGYSAAVAVPACDILLKSYAITWFCDFYVWCDIFIFYDMNLLVNRLKRNFCQLCIMCWIILIPNFNEIRAHILKIYII